MIGRTIGPYQVLSKIGEGGMGEVYLAALNHPNALTIFDVGHDGDRLSEGGALLRQMQ